MGVKTKKQSAKVVGLNPMSELDGLLETKTESKKVQKEENIMPITEELSSVVVEVVKAYEVLQSAKSKFGVLSSSLMEKAKVYLEEKSFEIKKNFGSFFVDGIGLKKRVQIVPSDRFSDISGKDADEVNSKLVEIRDILGSKFDEFVEEKSVIAVKEDVVEDKEKLIKFVSFVKANPELANMIQISKSYKIKKGSLDKVYTLSQKKKEEFLSIVKLAEPSLKVVGKKE